MGMDIRPGMLLRHYKGGLYLVICVAYHTELDQPLVIYHPVDDTTKIYARPRYMFNHIVDGGVQRFTEVE